MTKTYYAGRRDPETDVLPMGWSGSITIEVKNDALDQMMQDIDDARRTGVATPQMAIIVYEEYPDGALDGAGGRTSVFMDVQFTYSNRRQGGMQEKIVKTLNFSASRKILQ